MGSGCSKKKGTDAAGPVQLKINAPERMPQGSADDSKVAADLSSYEAACRVDPDLQAFDRVIHDRTSQALNSLATGAGGQTLSFDSLKEEYLENSIKTLEFCGGLENCLKRARTNQLIIQLAVQKFEEEVKVQGEGEGDGDERKFGKTLDELNKFKAAEKPFDEEFFRQFRSVYDQQLSLFKKLQQQKRKVDKKLKKAKTWRKLSNILFVTVFVSVVVFSVVAAAIAAPPVVTAVAGALIVPVGSVGKWCSSLWTRYENKLKGQQELIGSMEFGTYYFTIKDMETIGVLVRRMETKIESLLYGADFAVREQEAVKLVIDEMKKKLEEFMETIEDLGKQADKCSREIRKARTVILQKIIGPSSQSSTLDSLWNRLNL
ncbi:hypothetical protein SLA2020_132970 [Shorea laevis]